MTMMTIKNDRVYVEIVQYDDETIVRRMGPMSRHQADKVERGVEINLNHERFFVRQAEVSR